MTLALIGLLAAALLAVPAARLLRAASALVLPLPFVAVFAVLAARAEGVLAGEVPREVLAEVEPLGVVLALRLDGLGLMFALLVCGIGAVVLVHAAGYFANSPRTLGRFAGLAYLFAVAMLGVVLADDLVLLFIAWELTSLCSFLLIGLQHEGADARAGATRALVVTGAGGIALLVGVLLLAQATGTTSIGELLEQGDAVRGSGLYLPILVLVVIAAFTKSAQAPFHYWLPGAMAAPGPVSAFLHSATLVKAGVFLLARLHPVLGFRPEWNVVLGHAGALTLVVGAVLAFSANDLKRLLAFTTVAGLGTIVMLLGIGTATALRAALLFTAVHALYKASLFLVVGYLDQRTGTRDLSRLGGLARHAPLAFFAALLAALSMSGLPPLLGAIAKELVYEAKLGAPEAPVVFAAAGTLGNALVVACAVLAGVVPFLRRGARPELHPVPGVRLLLGAFVLAVGGLLLGIFHESYAKPWIDAALLVVREEPQTPELTADAAPHLVAWLGKGTLALGVVAVLLRRRLLLLFERARGFAQLGPARAHERVLGLVFGVGERVDAFFSQRVVRRSLLASLLLFVATGWAWLAEGTVPVPDLAIEPLEALLVTLVAAGALVAVRASTTFAAVASLGVSGFGAGMLFLVLGGPDLAMTQIAVETLAVLLLLAVLGRAPLERERSAPGAPALDTALAVAVGLVLTALVWAAAPDGTPGPLARALAEASVPEGFGRNVVNVILVDFRSLDTLGEIFVLAIAALGVLAVLRGEDGEVDEPPLGRAHFPTSPILRAAARSLVPLLALLSVVLLVRGHQEPGGGFVGGLVAAAAAMLHAFAFGIGAARARVAPDRWLATGLAIALAAGSLGLLFGDGFLDGLWLSWSVPAVGKLGTPLLFDVGVFLVVVGVSTRVLFPLLESEELVR